MPDPRPGENKDEFIARCMRDEEAMDDFPDSDQRFAFCNSKYEQFVSMKKSKSGNLSRNFLEVFWEVSKNILEDSAFREILSQAIPKSGGKANAEKRMIQKIHDTIAQLSQAGREYAFDNFDAEVINRWINPDFARVELSEKELEELSLSMGHHRHILIGEAMGSMEAGFNSRAGGLNFSIDQTTQLIKRIKEARENQIPLSLSQWDFINFLGTNSYERIIIDHSEWMNSLSDEKIGAAQLLENFRADFQELTDTHSTMQENLRGSELLIQQVIEQQEITKGQEGVMIGFFLPKNESKKLAVKNGESIKNLHMTVTFHGKKKDLPKNAKDIMMNVLKEVTKDFGPIKGKINGFGQFNPSKNSNGKSVLYANFDAPLLPEFRQRLIDKLEKNGIGVKKDHGFTPHITLSYLNNSGHLDDEDEEEEEDMRKKIKNQEITFKHITLAFGDKRHNVRFKGSDKVRKQEISEETRNALEGARNILQAFEDEIPEEIFTIMNNLLRGDNRIERSIKKQELSEDAQNAVIGAIRILQEFDNELPDRLISSLFDLLGEEAAETLAQSKKKTRKDIFCEFLTKQEDQKLVYGVVLEPNTLDAHDDFISAAAIEEAAHEFMLKSQTIGKGHKNAAKAKIVQSFIAPSTFTLQGETVKKGSWVIVTKVLDDILWKQIINGEFTGYSVGGFGHLVERGMVS